MENDEINLLEGVLNTTTPKRVEETKTEGKKDTSIKDRKEKSSDTGGRVAEVSTPSQMEEQEVEPESADSFAPTKTLLLK